MLTPAIFNDLHRKDQVDLIQQEAIFLGSREIPEFTIDLYALDEFYVEVFYHETEEDLVMVKGSFDFDHHLYSKVVLNTQLKVA
jgi:hypothetical protein